MHEALILSIPKILHFTWKTDDVPGKMGEFLAMWRELHADWDVRLWTDATMREFVAAEYPDFVAAYDGYPHPIQRADSFRYLVLNRLGGVYSDLDVEPYKSINGLVEGLTCFVGVEPDEHMGADRKHAGTPYLLTNAFMGAVPGHIYFRTLVELLPGIADNPNIFYSTGPAVTTAGAVRLARADRPTLVPPCLWSPLCDGGKPCQTDDHLFEVLGEDFDFHWLDRKAVVSHLWLTSWVPFHKRYSWLAKPFHAIHNFKWWVREKRFPKLAAVAIPDQLRPYNDQTLKPIEPLPRVCICVALVGEDGLSDDLATALVALDYPKELLSIVVGSFAEKTAQSTIAKSISALMNAGFEDIKTLFVIPPEIDDLVRMKLLPENVAMVRSAVLRNALVEASGDAAWVLSVGGEVADMPPAALRAALATGYPVVGAAMVDADGKEVDFSTHRYHWGAGIRVTYKIRGADGVANWRRGQRDYLLDQKVFRTVPLDGVGRGFVLVDRAVLDAGVCFAETPYNLHLDGEGFALMARVSGFEVAGATSFVVRRL